MVVNRLLRGQTWPVVAIGLSLATIGVAHAVERLAYLAPCELCLRQREVYWAIAAMALTGLVLARIRPTRRFQTALNVLLGLAFIVGAVVAAFHAGVEWRLWPAPEGCAPATGSSILDFDPGALDAPMATVSCLDAPWRMLGLSMAGWNALFSLGLSGASFWAASNHPDGEL